MHPTALLPIPLLLLIQPTLATISLNESGPYWYYTASKLASTTKPQCLTAYSAPIACPMTLVGLVTSLRPDFQPTQDDLDRMCTMECKSSLEDYVQTVGTNCGGKGDLATERRIKNGLNNTYARVWTVGQMFEYTYAQSCAKDENGDYCPLTSTTLPSTAANCTSPCSVSFYTNAHDFLPASEKQFLYSYLTTQTAYWIKQYQQGWKALVACGAAVGAPALATASSGGGFAQVTGLPAGAESTGVSGDLSDEGVTSPVTGTSSGGGGVATGTGSTTSATTAAASSTVTVLQDKNGGSVVEVDLKSVIALGVLGLIAAAILL